MAELRKRSLAVLLLLGIFLLLFAIFIVQYGFFAYTWATFRRDTGSISVVTDRDGERLLTFAEDKVYTADPVLRKATVHLLGDRQRKVYAPVLSYYDGLGHSFNLLNGLYSYGDSRTRARLTISSQLQKAALTALGDRKGTIAVMNYRTGEILCAVSSPTFDPDRKGEAVDSMYVNRFFGGLYTPGSIYKIVTLAIALEEMPGIESRIFTCTGETYFGTDKIICPVRHDKQTLQEAFRNSCNCAFATLATELGVEKMTAYAEKFDLTEKMNFDGITTAAGRYDANVSLPWSGAGQGDTKINPCSFLAFVSAVARDGQGIRPYLMDTVRDGYRTLYRAKTAEMQRMISTETAAILQTYLRSNVSEKYGDEYFPGFRFCAKTGTAEVGTGKPNALLCGFSLDNICPVAFIIIVEDSGSGGSVCLPIAASILDCLVRS